MKEILQNYTKEEIEALALKQLENENNEEILKVEKIDKEYKKHNKRAVMRAIINGSMIMIFSGIIMNSEADLASFGTEDISNIIDSITSNLEFLPGSEIINYVYAKMFEGLNKLIDQIGIMGLIIASRSIKFVLSSFKDTKKSLDMKKEIQILKDKITKHEQKNLK